MTLRPNDYDRNGDIIPDSVREDKGDTISRSALKENMKSRLSACNEWIEKAKDKETKIRASAVKAFIVEVVMTIDNAPTVETFTKDEYEGAYLRGYVDSAKANERPKGEWEYEHELSCGRILKLRLNVVEHKCNKCKHWSIKWAGTIPDNYCSHCGEVMRKAEAKPKMSGKERFCSDVLCNQNYGGWCTSECPKKQEKEEET